MTEPAPTEGGAVGPGPSDDLRRLAMELAAISESALAYCTDAFDIERFHRIGELAGELRERIAAEPGAAYRREVASAAGYTTPKLDVRGAIFDADGRVLLVREIADGRWTLPGGWCDVLGSARESVEREVREEAGVDVEATQLAAVLDRERWPHTPPMDHHVYKLLFLCTPRGPVDLGFTSDETDAVAWFPADDLPELSVGRVLPDQIALAHEQWLRPGPAVFD